MDEQPDPQLLLLSQALGNLRDSWMKVAFTLRDYIDVTPSPARDEILVQFMRKIAKSIDSD
jgi:hypothetical protein